jgi:hypothetical protein
MGAQDSHYELIVDKISFYVLGVVPTFFVLFLLLRFLFKLCT